MLGGVEDGLDDLDRAGDVLAEHVRAGQLGPECHEVRIGGKVRELTHGGNEQGQRSIVLPAGQEHQRESGGIAHNPDAVANVPMNGERAAQVSDRGLVVRSDRSRFAGELEQISLLTLIGRNREGLVEETRCLLVRAE